LKAQIESDVDILPEGLQLLIKTVALIDNIIDPKQHIFSESVIQDAKIKAAASSSTALDIHFYDGVLKWD